MNVQNVGIGEGKIWKKFAYCTAPACTDLLLTRTEVFGCNVYGASYKLFASFA